MKQKTVAADGWGSYEKAEELVNYIFMLVEEEVCSYNQSFVFKNC